MSRPKSTTATPRQKEVLEWVERFIEENGMPPTVREIGRGLDIDPPNVVYFLKELQRKGYLRRGNLGARSLIIDWMTSRPGGDRYWIPEVGQVAAGQPILAEENIQGYVRIPEELMPRTGEVFALRVRGDSMIGAGIHDGDLVVVQKQEEAQSGDVVVALVDGEATLKRLKRIGRRLWLQPANSRYQPIRFGTGEGDRICGRVISLMRRIV
jgi:repressor LexA